MGNHRTIALEEIGLLEGHNFGLKFSWVSKSDRSVLKLNLRLAVKFRCTGETAMPAKSSGRAPSFSVLPWHLSYDCGNNHGKNSGS